MRHCSGVGSTPVGLCAHAWSRKMEPDGAASRSFMNPSKSNVFVARSRYLYRFTSKPANFMIGMWLPQVGSEA